MERIFMAEHFNPDKYGMICCPVCKGSGKLFLELDGWVVCEVCGGFGFVKKQRSGSEERLEQNQKILSKG